MENIATAHREWADMVWDKIQKKLRRTAAETGDRCFPYSTKNGKFYNDKNGVTPSWWTNGFWVGILWLMYHETGDTLYKDAAESLENQLDTALAYFTELNHDIGFMWLLSAVADYRITGSEASKRRGLHAASLLAGRFNPAGQLIRAWNDWGDGVDRRGWAIIDCLMNIPLLYWASQETGDTRFRQIATQHADTVMERFVRPDGSVKHIVEFDLDTGEYVRHYGGQGYSLDSSWTRGQAWALYGFTLSYLHTGKQAYLDTAKRIAHYFIANLQDDDVPPCDFRSPKTPVYKDTTAGACAACGLLEIAKAVPETEQDLYRGAAFKILRATEERYCDWSDTEDSIVQMGTEAYGSGEQNIPLIYGDYFFIEAVLKLRGGGVLLW